MLFEKVQAALAQQFEMDPESITLDTNLIDDIGADSLDVVELIMNLEDEFGIAIMLIEHDMNLVMGICEGIAVLNYGKIIAKGTPREIQTNPVVIEAYLGEEAIHDA